VALFGNEVAGLFIAAPDSAKNQLVWKWPQSSIRALSSVIVDADQVALFVSSGQVVGALGPGRHKLDAKEWPFLGAIVDAATNGNAFRAELFFASTKQFPNEKFGGKVDNVVDPRTGLVVSMTMFGEYALQVKDPAKLVLNLIGTGTVADDSQVQDWTDQQLLKSLRTFITGQISAGEWPVLGLSAHLPEMETTGLASVNSELEQYGVNVVKFGNLDVALSEEDEKQLKALSKDVAYSQLAGSFGAYAAGAALIGAGQGMAQGGAGAGAALIGAGFGVAGGAGMAMAQDRSVPVGPHRPDTHPDGVPAGVPTGHVFCAQCGASTAVGAKFCAQCGSPLGASA
jgi:membrane protease subunit (stomatin/prohibitin family)